MNNTSISANKSNFTLIIFKAACYTIPGAKRKLAGSRSHISKNIVLRLSNTSAKNNVLL